MIGHGANVFVDAEYLLDEDDPGSLAGGRQREIGLEAALIGSGDVNPA